MIFLASDGIRIHCKSCTRENAKGDVLVLHGMGEHLGRYAEFAERLNKAGYNAHLMDWRGHGCSEGLSGHVEKFSQFFKDIESWIQFLEGQGLLDPIRPKFLFGHSMGGLIALDFAFHHRDAFVHSLDGIALSSPAVGVLNPIVLLKPVFDLALPGMLKQLHFPNGIKPEQLSHDKEILKEYANDPLVHNKVTIGLVREMLAAIDRVRRNKSALPFPALVLYGDQDSIVDPEALQKFAKNLQAVDKEVKEFRGFFHEVFNEKKRAQAYEIFLDWLNRWAKPQKQKAATRKSTKSSSKSSGKKASVKAISRSPRGKKVRSIST